MNVHVYVVRHSVEHHLQSFENCRRERSIVDVELAILQSLPMVVEIHLRILPWLIVVWEQKVYVPMEGGREEGNEGRALVGRKGGVGRGRGMRMVRWFG